MTASQNIRISVRGLVEQFLRRGDLSSPFESLSRSPSLAGTKGHQQIQRSRPGSYRAEVAVNYAIQSGPYALEIQGRIDGVYLHKGKVVVEEIKTTQRDLDTFISNQQELDWAQVRVYAACLAAEQQISELTLRLTYLQAESGQTRTVFQEESGQALLEFLHDLIRRYLEWRQRMDHWITQRNQGLSANRLPYPCLREGQVRMMEEVRSTFRSEGQCLIQAPTGTGKTVAALYPALQSLAEGKVSRLFYLTARGTGRAIVETTLNEMAESGLVVKYLTLTAKQKICFLPDRECSPEACPYARGYYDRLPQAQEAFFGIYAFTRERLLHLAEEHSLCPFELSLDLALWVDVVICDYNYALDPRIYLKRFFLENQVDSGFLVDEAHNLVDRGREMFSAEIRKSSFLEIRRRIRDKKSAVYRLAGRINSLLLKKSKQLSPENHSWDSERPVELLSLLRRYTAALEKCYSARNDPHLKKILLEHYFTAHWFQRVSESQDETYAVITERRERELRVKLFCLDPSQRLGPAFMRARCSVLFSATLSPLPYFRQILGLEPEARLCRLPSPFPAENLCVLTAASVSTYFRHRRRTLQELVQVMGAFTAVKPGNYLVFFPSYAYLNMLCPLYRREFPGHLVLAQEPGMSEAERERFLSRFSCEDGRTLVGMTVLGGIFGEGIDLMGDRLTGAVIVGVGLPGITLERELIRRFFDEEEQAGFNYSYVYPGMIRVLQAAGRVIRSEYDRGAVLLIDPRYARPLYRELLPQEWFIQPLRSRNEIRRILDRFWNHGSHASPRYAS